MIPTFTHHIYSILLYPLGLLLFLTFNRPHATIPQHTLQINLQICENIIPMDWYSWLSKTSLEPSLVYKYGLTFSDNELQKEDISYFNHEFLLSMGISIAKHRLEILKLARKETRGSPNTSLSKLIIAINKTRKRFNKYVNKLVHHESNATKKPIPTPMPLLPGPDSWREAMSRKYKSDQIEQPMMRTMKTTKSGPLDYRGQEKSMVTTRSLQLSGPLDRKLQEKLMFSYRSPMPSGPIDVAMARDMSMFTNKIPKFCGPPSPEKAGGDFSDPTLWEALFQDMKPT